MGWRFHVHGYCACKSRHHQLLAILKPLLCNNLEQTQQAGLNGLSIPKGYGAAAGSHVWQGGAGQGTRRFHVHAEGAHVEVSCPLASSSYRSAEFLQFHLMTMLFSLKQLFCATLAVLEGMEWQKKLVTSCSLSAK